MGLLERIENVIFGLVMVYLAVELAFEPESYLVIIVLLSAMMTWSGIKTLYFYFTMSRFMVGGRMMLYKGVLFIDIAVFTLSLVAYGGPYRAFILMYLIIYHMFNGGIDVARALEARGGGARKWKAKLTFGVLNVLLAIICIIFFNNMEVAIIIYCVGLGISGVSKIISAFERTDVVYIQ